MFKQCKICDKFFNPIYLSEVFEHEHKGIQTDKEYFGKEVRKEIEMHCPKCGEKIEPQIADVAYDPVYICDNCGFNLGDPKKPLL